MKNFANKWKKSSAFLRAFLILAFVFLVVGLGTLGSVQSTGESYELKKNESDTDVNVIFHLTSPSSETVRLYRVFINVGTIYAEAGQTARLLLAHSYSSNPGTNFYNPDEAVIANFFAAPDEDGKEVAATEDGLYNWTEPFKLPDDGYSITSYPYWRLTAKGCNVRVNEIVFYGQTSNSHEWMRIPAEIDSNSVFPLAEGESRSDAAARAGALLDSQQIPAMTQSTFFRFTEEELYSLMSISEMRAGNYFESDAGHYMGDRVYNALGTDILALGVGIFGMSPFGLRFFPMLASFGVLVAGFCFVRRLARSDKAGFIFALLYAFCGVSFGLGHLGTPLMIGLFFFMAALDLCHAFYANGIKNADFRSLLPLVFSGLFTGASICVNGVFLIPALGVVGLFAAGMYRQQVAKKYYLEKAAALEEEEAALPPEYDESGEEIPKENHTAEVEADYRYKNRTAPLVFGAFLVLGAIVISLLALLPMNLTYLKLFDIPAAPTMNVFGLGWQAFANGFAGSNPTYVAGSAWDIFHIIFRGTGDVYAVTGNGAMIAIAALIAGVFGLIFSIARVIMLFLGKKGGKEFRSELRAVVIPVAGIALMLLSACFAGGAQAFIFGAMIFTFTMAAYGVGLAQGETLKAVNALSVVWGIALAVFFIVFSPLIFSIPFPAGFMGAIFG